MQYLILYKILRFNKHVYLQQSDFVGFNLREVGWALWLNLCQVQKLHSRLKLLSSHWGFCLERTNISCGIPQSTILGPILFCQAAQSSSETWYLKSTFSSQHNTCVYNNCIALFTGLQSLIFS